MNGVVVPSLMAILQSEAYETLTSPASHRRAYYATAGTRPNALANGLGIALFANTEWNLLAN